MIMSDFFVLNRKEERKCYMHKFDNHFVCIHMRLWRKGRENSIYLHAHGIMLLKINAEILSKRTNV